MTGDGPSPWGVPEVTPALWPWISRRFIWWAIPGESAPWVDSPWRAYPQWRADLSLLKGCSALIDESSVPMLSAEEDEDRSRGMREGQACWMVGGTMDLG